MAHRSDSPYRIAWRKFKRNKLAMVAAGWILFCAFVSLFGYLISPDKTTHANQQMVEVKLKELGFRIEVLKIARPGAQSSRGLISNLLAGRTSDSRLVPITSYRFIGDEISVDHFMGSKESFFQESYKLTTVLGIGPSLTDEKALQQRVEEDHISSRHYPLGTDALGRDFLSRLILGTRVSLAVGVVGVIISMVLGLVLGLLAGWYRGWLDDLITYFAQVFWAIPTVLFALCLSLVMSSGLWQVFLAIGLTMWVEVARLVRGQVMVTRELSFVQASRALGLRQARIVMKHILPNIMGPVLVVMAANFAAAILLEAGLSFLGLGVPSPTPSWGMMLSENRNYLVAGMPHLSLLPGAAICLLVLSFFTVSNGLRDAFDVKLK